MGLSLSLIERVMWRDLSLYSIMIFLRWSQFSTIGFLAESRRGSPLESKTVMVQGADLLMARLSICSADCFVIALCSALGIIKPFETLLLVLSLSIWST